MSIYMKFGDIKGEVTAEGYSDHIELTSISFSANRAISMSATGGADKRESGRPSLNEILVSKYVDGTSRALFQDNLVGAMGSKVEIKLTRTKPDGGEQEYLTLTLTNGAVSSYAMTDSAGSDRGQESLSIAFTKIEYKYTSYDQAGKTPKPDTVTYDLTTVKKT
jgi:type VI secretion system secreted protein Hcp